MTYRLPKDVRTLVYSDLTGFELNDFDVERLLPTFYDIVITHGRERSASKLDLENYQQYVERLSTHDQLVGFDTSDGRRALDVLVHAGIARVATKSLKRNTAVLDYIQPIHLLCYRSGLPRTRSRQRKVHSILCELLHVRLESAGQPSARNALQEILVRAVGNGASVQDAAHEYDIAYDGSSDIDLTALLAFYYVEPFTPGALRRPQPPPSPLPLPTAADVMADDLISYLVGYADLPATAIARNLMALINFELFAYTLRMMGAVERVVGDPDEPEFGDEHVAASTELYVDFTRRRQGPSDDLARRCVNRDLERCRRYFEAQVLLRETERAVRYLPELRQLIEGLDPSERFPAIARLIGCPEVDVAAGMALAQLEQAVAEDETSNVDEFVEAVSSTPGSPVQRLAKIIANQPRSRGVENTVKWLWSTGGLKQSFGLIRGNLRGPRNWRYAMSDDLLSSLVQVALLEYEPGHADRPRRRSRLSLESLLRVMETRYGLLIARPPSELDSAEARRAADENLVAFKSRLRQLGYFEALSDDFNAQYVTNPHQAASARSAE